MKILSLFSGIGAFEKALERLQVQYELVNYCEIDKYASKAYSLIHNEPESKNLGDITKVDEAKLDDFDLMTWGFPCQDISIAGRQQGVKEGTRSGLYYEGLRILKYKRPKYSIIENVKNLVSKKFKDTFEQILKDLDECGYNNYWQVLNAKDYGVPQNRERVFIVSIRKDVNNSFEFPKPFELKLKLKNMLEESIDNKYYLSNEYLLRFIESRKSNEFPFGETYKVIGSTVGSGEGTNSRHWVYDTNYNISTLDATMYKQPKQIWEPKVMVKEATKQGYTEATVGDSINIQYPNSQTRRGRVGQGVAQTIETSSNQATLTLDYRIRKLTPLECFRLMGFDDSDYYILKQNNISDSQLYKMAGNSIVVDVLYYIFVNLARGNDFCITQKIQRNIS